MNTYIFSNRFTDALEIRVQATDESAAYIELENKLRDAEAIGIYLPDNYTWDLVAIY